MKNLLLIFLAIVSVSCSKKAAEEAEKKRIEDTLKIVDSINAQRAKYNDSISARNNRNVYRDYSGNHKFTHSEISGEGSVKFTKTGRDEYSISGNIISGNNSVKINGTGELVTEKFLNFEGEIEQKINGKKYLRTKNSSFKNEGIGNFWRLQDKVNPDGFVDHIDIYF